MASALEAFAPSGETITIAATTTASANAALPVGGGDTLLVTNAGTTIAFVHMSALSSGDLATAVDVPVLGPGQIILSCPPSIISVSVIMASGTASIYATRGYGTQH